MRNIALLLAYDGTDFIGSQWQNQGRSVQGALEEAWEALTQEQKRITLSGRTDAGVHAYGQVASIRSTTRHPPLTIVRGLNARLPEDLRVQDACEVTPDFHARHSAIRRDYRYLIDANMVPLPALRHMVLHVEGRLDLAHMAEALQILEGTHDFAAFTVQSPDQKRTVRTMHCAKLTEIELLGGRLIALDVAANAFLQHMVRVIVGTVLLVGRGRMTVSAFQQVLEGGERKAAGPTAAAHGLTLMAVHYPPGLVRWESRQA
ncbi:tRNA pseudouridine(38-40) synthase TruA [Candidatus Chloroploca asiatica]|uniref:tRNA pseudouridine synthase A n=1 Tax=Candidatus Chloroploca asiatica TaxID=1506545 RepID=A0A2H3L2D9_9CHLR|nr:tRNA pseudouridine(38,39,40) synthase TruA [Candidatus Chloroploca asiatica]